jgi:hypothetical protein
MHMSVAASGFELSVLAAKQLTTCDRADTTFGHHNIVTRAVYAAKGQGDSPSVH